MVSANGPFRQRLVEIIAELRSQDGPRSLELASKRKELDGLHQRLRRLFALVESGSAPSRATAVRISEIEQVAQTVESSIQALEQLLLTTASDTVLEDIAESVTREIGELPNANPEEQDRILHTMLHEVRLAHDRPIKLKLWMPAGGNNDKNDGGKGTKESIPRPAEAGQGVLVSPSRMVEATERWLNYSWLAPRVWIDVF